MAGLLDSLPQDGLLGYIRSLDQATQPFMGDYWKQVAPNAGAGGVNILDYLKDLDRRTGNPMIGGLVSGARQPDQPALNVPQSGDMGMMYGQQPAQPAQPAPQQPALPPSIASAPMSPQGAQQAFNLPTGSYEFGGQLVPTFGQPQAAPVEASAQRRQQTAIPAEAAAPSAPPVASNPAMDFLSAIRPGFVGRYEARKTQQQNAQNLATFFQGQGMNPQQAQAMAAVAAQNPKIMEEFFKQPATVEGAIARDMAFGTGGGGRQGGIQRALDWKRNVNAADEEGKKSGALAVEKQELQRVLPSFVDEAQSHIRMVEELRNHPGRKGNVWWHGKGSSFLPDASIPGNTDAGDALNRLKEIKGGAFLEAFKALKGGGQITEIEGKKATEAKNRMDRATSEKEFNQATDDYIGAIKRGLEKLQREAGVAPNTAGLAPTSDWQVRPGNIRVRRIGD
jgi:hypothetical protein